MKLLPGSHLRTAEMEILQFQEQITLRPITGGLFIMQRRNSNTNLAFSQEELQCHSAQKSSLREKDLYPDIIPIGTPPKILNHQEGEVRKHNLPPKINDVSGIPDEIDFELHSEGYGLDQDDFYLTPDPYIDDEDKVESFCSIKHRKEMMKLSPYFQHDRLLKCGRLYLEFRSSKKRSPYYIQTRCHSQFCPKCVDKDRRKGTRTLKTIGEALLKFAPWYHIVMTIPAKYRSHYLTNELTDKFRNDCYEIIIEELGLWNNLDRFDRSGAVLCHHWFGDDEEGYNYHVDMMIPAIRYGKPIEDPILDKGAWKKHFDKVRKRMAMRMSNDVGEKVSYKDMNFLQ